jgi:hypothetical protein
MYPFLYGDNSEERIVAVRYVTDCTLVDNRTKDILGILSDMLWVTTSWGPKGFSQCKGCVSNYFEEQVGFPGGTIITAYGWL